MAQPIVGYYTANGGAQVSSWAIGEIDANSTSPTLNVSIWNNKGGTSDVSHMKNVTVTCLDSTGGDTDPMVAEAWMQAWINNELETSKKAIGGTVKKDVNAIGLDPAMAGHTIYGTANGGVIGTDVNNYALANFTVKVPANAKEGQHDFKIRTEYFYT